MDFEDLVRNRNTSIDVLISSDIVCPRICELSTLNKLLFVTLTNFVKFVKYNV